MTVGELFINIGVKGSPLVGKALAGIKEQLGTIGQASLGAEAAILGSIIALERLTGWASKAGSDLYKFNVITGINTMTLQKWQREMNLADVSAEETASSFKSVQDAMTEMDLSGTAPTGLAFMAETLSKKGLGGFDTSRIKDTAYVMERLQTFAKNVPPTLAKNIEKSFGLTENFIQGLIVAKNGINEASESGLLTDDEVKRLNSIREAWSSIWFNVEAVGKKMVSAFGFIPVQALQNVTTLFVDALSAALGFGGELVDLGEKFQSLKLLAIGVAIAIGLYFAPLTTILWGLIAVVNDIQKFREGKDSIIGSVGKKFSSIMGGEENVASLAMGGAGQKSEGEKKPMGFFDALIPQMKTTPQSTPPNMSNVTNIYGVEDKKIASTAKEEVGNAFFQMASSARGF